MMRPFFRNQWVFAFLAGALVLAFAAGADAAKKKTKKARKDVAPVKRPEVTAFVAYPKAETAPPRLLTAMGLDAFTDYKVALQLTDDDLKKVAEFYVKALGRVPRKETSDSGVGYTFFVNEPNDTNPLGNKVVVEEKTEGTPDVAGKKWRVTITGFWRLKK